MARPRKPPDHPPSRRGKRDYAAEYRFRVRGTEVGERSLARGHRGQTKAFLKSLHDGDLILCDIGSVVTYASTQTVKGKRRKVQRYREIPKTVIPSLYREKGKLKGGGPTRYWILKGLTRAELLAVIIQEQKIGVEFAAQPSQDQQKLLSQNENEGGY